MAAVSALLEIPTAANVQWHIRVVSECAQRRALVTASQETVADVYDTREQPIADVVDRAQQRVFRVSGPLATGGMVAAGTLTWPAMERFEQRQAAGGGITGLATGFKDLDDKTSGFQAGDLVLVAARPSMGKTAFATGVLLNAALATVRRPVALFSLEMSREQCIDRFLCHEGRVDILRYRKGQLLDDEYHRMVRAVNLVDPAPVWIDDTGALSVLEIRAKARRLKAEQPDLGLVVVDYIGLMKAGEGENRTQQLGSITRALKALAKELDIPIIALSQLSRAPEQRSDRRPQLSDLRESGDLEQDADMVLFLYRPAYYLTPNEAREQGVENKADLIIGKQRNGPTGTVPLYFAKECARFDSLAPSSWTESS
jgi:replicative DNA helicase